MIVACILRSHSWCGKCLPKAVPEIGWPHAPVWPSHQVQRIQEACTDQHIQKGVRCMLQAVAGELVSRKAILCRVEGPFGGSSSPLIDGSCEVAVIFAGGIGVGSSYGPLHPCHTMHCHSIHANVLGLAN